MIKPPAATVFSWLKANLGPRCLAPLTSTDAKALQAAVQIIDLWSQDRNSPKIIAAFGVVVDKMQPHTKELAYHAIAHVLDWSDREEIWGRAALEPVQTRKCKFE